MIRPLLTDYAKAILNGDWMSAIFGSVIDLVGLPALSFVAIGSTMLALWSWSQSFMLLGVWSALIGSVVFATAPGTLVLIAYLAWAWAIAMGLLAVIVGNE